MNSQSRFRINLIFTFAILLLGSIGAYSFYESAQLPPSHDEAVLAAKSVLQIEVSGLLFGTISMLLALVLVNRSFKREQQVLTELQRFSSLVQNSGDLIAIGSLDRKMQYMNPAGQQMLGFDGTQSVVGLPTMSIYAPEDNKLIESEVIPTLKEKGSWRGELRYQHAQTGEHIPVQMNTFAMRDNDQLIGFATVSKDLREQKKLKKDLDRFFNVSLDMLAIANTSGYFLRLNPAFTEILGYTEDELRSRPCTDFIHPDDIAPTLQQIERQSKGHSIISFENRYRTKSGDYRWFSWKSFPDGEMTYGAARDITEEKAQKALMEKLNQTALAASQAKSEFLANMSHEIRTPINGVIGSTTLLLDTKLSPEQHEYAENINTSANSLLTVINDILDFSKIEAGKLDIEIVDFDLDDLIEETVKNISWSLKNKSLPLIVTFEKGAQRIYRGDPGRIRQILTNLLSNAVKFTSHGSIQLEVRALQTAESKTEFRFSVQDSGIGISEAAQKKLFQAFSQADESTTRKFGGTGLGLSICHRLVKLMGGEVGLHSVEGQGSTFWFSLTLEKSFQAPVETNTKFKLAETQFAGASILVAEDNVINQKILIAMLQKMGIRTQAVANGNEALSLLREVPFDMILMDCQMPVMDGYETARRIRESQTLPCKGIPIIAMTANALKGDRERCLAAGMSDYASKPIKIQDLAAMIQKWLPQGVRENIS